MKSHAPAGSGVPNVVRAVTGVLLITASALAMSLAFAVPAALASGRPVVVYGLPDGHLGGSNFVHGRVRPTGMLMWTGDGSGYFIIHSWRSWSSTGAWGTATVHARSCWGGCWKYKTERTVLHLYKVQTHRGQRYFARLRFHLAHKVAGLRSSTLRFCPRGSPAWYYSC